MNILSAIFPKAKKITSEAIAVEIERAEADLAATHEKLAHVFDGLAVMSAEQHADAEDKATTFRRCGERLQARIVALRSEHEAAVAAEAEAAKVAAEAAHQKRIEAARIAVEIDGADLLREYGRLANAMADVLARVDEINEEAKACRVPSIDQMHRKTPDQPATETRSFAPHFVYKDAPPQPDEVHPGETEKAYRATLDDAGKPIPPAGVQYGRFGQIITPQLEQREVITRTQFRPGRVEDSLDSVRLPPAFAGGQWAWPRS